MYSVTVTRILQLLLVMAVQIVVAHSETTTHVQAAKSRILREIAADLQPTAAADTAVAPSLAAEPRSSPLPTAAALHRGPPPLGPRHVFDLSDEQGFAEVRRDFERDHHRAGPSHRRGGERRRRQGASFSRWSPWTKCDRSCTQSRERHCYQRRSCGSSRHIEERRCPSHSCSRRHQNTRHMHQSSSSAYRNHREPTDYELADFGGSHNDLDDTDGEFYVVRKPHKRPNYSGEDDSTSSRPVYVVHKPHRPQPAPKQKNKKKKIVVEVQDYNEDFEADTAPAATAYRQRAPASPIVQHQYASTHDDDLLHHHQSYHHPRQYADGDNDSLGSSIEAGDFDVIAVEDERYKHQQKHRQQRRPPSPPPYYERRPSTVRPYRSARPSSSGHYGSSRHRHRPAPGGQNHRHRHHYDDDDQHRQTYSHMRKKHYTWDRQTDFAADTTRNNRPQQQLFHAGGETSAEETSVEQPDLDGNDWRTSFNRDLNDRLDRNYQRVFGSNHNAQTTTTHQSSTADHQQQVSGAGGDDDQYSDADVDGGEDTTDDTAGDHAERRQFSGSNIFQRRWDGGVPAGVGAGVTPVATAATGRSMQWGDGLGNGGQQAQPLQFQAIPSAVGSRNVSNTMTPSSGPGTGSRQAAAMQEKAVFDVPSSDRGVRRVYGKWSKWSKCSAKCTTKRWRRCKNINHCYAGVIQTELAYCYTADSFCQTWIDKYVQRVPTTTPTTTTIASTTTALTTTTTAKPFAISHMRPAHSNRRDSPPTALANNNFNNFNSFNNQHSISSNDVFAAPPASPSINNYRCGLPTVRNRAASRNTPQLWNMVRILGGKAARRGQWPWQVVIKNRYRENFCGGTLVSARWVLTAAHCVRRKLFVGLGEHNLAQYDGSELEFRVEAAFKHRAYNKKTVDNDVAMLRLPKPVQPEMYIGFACLPQLFQPLPKQHQCTIIGWGKRRNSDDTGTNVLHEAEVPIIPNEDCKQVYRDYTITKNMFCAGHRRGRIDTCAGDSGGPLLCRDTTQLNQPWTIFGITSFGDGCGKRNKFGIYAKVPNYVDWIQSVIDCEDGHCTNATMRAL